MAKLREGEQHQSADLEEELDLAEKTVDELRSEMAGVKQDLQDALELCNEHEALMEERNRELASCDAEIRYHMRTLATFPGSLSASAQLNYDLH